jgi:hypothetical protein
MKSAAVTTALLSLISNLTSVTSLFLFFSRSHTFSLTLSLTHTLSLCHTHTSDTHSHSLSPSLISFSGVFVKLGTLLAERLLYAPSVGYCMLLSLCVYKVARGFSAVCAMVGALSGDRAGNGGREGNEEREREVKEIGEKRTEADGKMDIPKFSVVKTVDVNDAKDSTVSTIAEPSSEDTSSRAEISPTAALKTRQGVAVSQAMLSKCMYWCLIAIITALYTRSTIRQNPRWFNDETLQASDLKICPRSAKLHLQLAKAAYNRGDFTVARHHTELSLEIDPQFCDVGYQVALLRATLDNDIIGSLEAAADNLHCVFTNTNSYELMHKLFDVQVKRAGGTLGHAVMAGQARITARGQLHYAAVRKYIVRPFFCPFSLSFSPTLLFLCPTLSQLSCLSL